MITNAIHHRTAKVTVVCLVLLGMFSNFQAFHLSQFSDCQGSHWKQPLVNIDFIPCTFTYSNLYNSESCLHSAGFDHHTTVVWISLFITCTYGIVALWAVITAYAFCCSIGILHTLPIEITCFNQAWVR